MIELKDGTKIFTRTIDHGADRWLIVTHGIGEHLERNNFFDALKNYNIFQYDLRGHGQSSGKRAYANGIQQYVEDLKEIIETVVHNGESYSLFGHSMGALITAALLQQKMAKPQKVFLSSPPVSIPGALGKIISLVPAFVLNGLSRLPLSFALGGMVDIRYLSHDPSVMENYVKDEKNILKLHSRLLFSLVGTSKKVFSNPIDIDAPIFCVVGSDDGIVDAKNVQKYFGKHNLKVISGGFHELHNEVDSYRSQYLDFLVESL